MEEDDLGPLLSDERQLQIQLTKYQLLYILSSLDKNVLSEDLEIH